MTIQEQLADKVKENFNTYLDRMAKSAHFSSKQNVPAIVRSNDCRKILDVGCADGSFTAMIARECPEARIVGLDINPKCIEEAKRKWGTGGGRLEFVCGELGELEERFDCIVFGSVMHEISSYCSVEKLRFGQTPIAEAIKEANERLCSGGIMVVRDWVDCTKQTLIRAKFNSGWYQTMFEDFISHDFAAIDHVSKDQMVFASDDTPGVYFIHETLLMEYLMTVTWGYESWKRETQERRFICKKGDWYEMAEAAGFSVIGWLQTTEEYPLYCDRVGEFAWDGKKWHMPDTTFVMVCRKD